MIDRIVIHTDMCPLTYVDTALFLNKTLTGYRVRSNAVIPDASIAGYKTADISSTVIPYFKVLKTDCVYTMEQHSLKFTSGYFKAV